MERTITLAGIEEMPQRGFDFFAFNRHISDLVIFMRDRIGDELCSDIAHDS
ncbi:MAG: hypothetical protein WBC91_09140 [Phototrophicaceae bacterium]